MLKSVRKLTPEICGHMELLASLASLLILRRRRSAALAAKQISIRHRKIQVNSLELVNTSKPRMTVAQLVNAHFEEKRIQRPRHQFSTGKTCNENPRLQQKPGFVARPPHILCVALNIKEPDTLPDLNDWREVLNDLDLVFETIQDSTRHVFYECVAFVYITGSENNHWVAANRVQCLEQKNRPTGYRWLLCDGTKTTCSVISGRTFNPLIRKGKIARVL